MEEKADSHYFKTELIVLAVNIPPQEPVPGHALFSISFSSFAEIFPAEYFQLLRNLKLLLNLVLVLTRFYCSAINVYCWYVDPYYTNHTAWHVLMHPPMTMSPSSHCAFAQVSIQSAITSWKLMSISFPCTHTYSI